MEAAEEDRGGYDCCGGEVDVVGGCYEGCVEEVERFLERDWVSMRRLGGMGRRGVRLTFRKTISVSSVQTTKTSRT